VPKTALTHLQKSLSLSSRSDLSKNCHDAKGETAMNSAKCLSQTCQQHGLLIWLVAGLGCFAANNAFATGGRCNRSRRKFGNRRYSSRRWNTGWHYGDRREDRKQRNRWRYCFCGNARNRGQPCRNWRQCRKRRSNRNWRILCERRRSEHQPSFIRGQFSHGRKSWDWCAG